MVFLIPVTRRLLSGDGGETTRHAPCAPHILRRADKTQHPPIYFWRFRRFAACCGPMNRSGKIHALLSTARVANIPSVVSTVWLGVVLAIFSGDVAVLEIPWHVASRLALALGELDRDV